MKTEKTKNIVKWLLIISTIVCFNNYSKKLNFGSFAYAKTKEINKTENKEKDYEDEDSETVEKQNKLKQLKLIDINGTPKSIKNESKIQKIVTKIGKMGITREMYVLELMRKNKNKDVNQIVSTYFKTESEILGVLLGNERIYTIKQGKRVQLKDESEKRRFSEILKKIKKRENSFVSKLIKKPEGENVVIVNPGHGFEDPGSFTKDKKGDTILEKDLNAKIAFSLTKKLLDLKYDVYWVFDLKKFYFPGIDEKKLKTLKENPRLHIIFPGRPAISGVGEEGFIAAADGTCMLEINKKIKKLKPKAKIASVCLHHNSSSTKSDSGFIAFYRIVDGKVTKQFRKQSIKLAKMFRDICGEVYAVRKDSPKIIQENNFLVCGFDKEFVGAAVLLELGYINNPEQLKKILNKKYNEKMVDALAKALCKYFKIKY